MGPLTWLASLGVVGDVVIVAMVATIIIEMVACLWLIVATTWWLRRHG